MAARTIPEQAQHSLTLQFAGLAAQADMLATLSREGVLDGLSPDTFQDTVEDLVDRARVLQRDFAAAIGETA